MNFDIDDPLADILSGGSDDSFFDDDILGKKKTPKKSTPLASKKSALFNLDDDDTKPSVPSATDTKEATKKEITEKNLEFKPKPVQVSTPAFREQVKTPVKSLSSMDIAQSATKENISNFERIDSSDRIKTPKFDLQNKSAENMKSSISLLDDILGPSTKAPAQTKPPSTSKSQEFDFDALLGNKSTPETQRKPSTAATRNSAPSESSKPEKAVKSVTPAAKPAKKSSDDWLGIFGDKEIQDQGKVDANEDTGMPAWLLGKDSKTSKASASKSKESLPKTPEAKKKDIHKEIILTKDEVLSKEATTPATAKSNENVFHLSDMTARGAPVLGTALSASNEDVTQEGAVLFMQQQESQLMVALQLKAQEEKLAAMQQRQEESRRIQQQVYAAQHTQLAALLEKRAMHTQQMQSIITSHQDRINQRIKALLMPSNFESHMEEDQTDGGGEGVGDLGHRTETPRKETPHVTERKQLLQLVQTLQENHDKEIDLMETSYRRQLAIADVALAQSEERMRLETDKLVKHYTERIEWAEEQARAQRERAQDDARRAEQRYEQLMKEERERGGESAKVLREQHAALMDNIKNAVSQERALIQDSSSYSGELTALLEEVRASKELCERLVESTRALQERGGLEAGRALSARENQVHEMLQQLTKDRENFEKEKSEDREIVKLLEVRLKQMTQSVEEETSAMKQRRMEFEYDKATFSKQTEFAKNILKRQEEEIKVMKEDIEKEYQEKLAKIEEEKSRSEKDSAITARERSTVHNLKQELEKLKAELQSQLEDVSEERSRINLEKQQLNMEEQRILSKSRDLDLLAKSALEKQSLADRKYTEAEYVQRKYEDRVRRLQEHVISLNSREKVIAREKVALSRERLEIHNERRQLESRQQCSLCRSVQNQIPFSNFPPSNVQSGALLRLNSEYLSMGVSRDYAGVASNANALEKEMSNLFNRELSARETDFEAGNVEPNVEPPRAHEVTDPKLLLLRLDVQQVINNMSGQLPTHNTTEGE